MRLRTRLIATSVTCILVTGVALLTVQYLLLSRSLDQGAEPARRKAEVELRLPVGTLSKGSGCAAGQVCEEVVPTGENGEIDRAPVQAGDVATEVQDQVRSQVLSSSLKWSLLLVASLLVVGGTVSFLIGRRAAAPVEALTEAARRLSTDRLHERVQIDDASHETTELAHSFNEMLARLESSFSAQRRFVANASHQLKTPLAIIRTQLDVARRTGTEVDGPLLDHLDQTVGRMEALVQAMLRLARAEGSLDADEVRLDELVARAVTEFPAPEIEMELDACSVRGDSPLLQEAIANLLDNAISHGTGAVRVQLVSEPSGSACLSVESSGPEIPPDAVEQLFEPFRQLDGQRTAGSKGHGLGLAIVRSIAAAHGGEATGEPLPGGGLRVLLRIPKDGPVSSLD